ncbi:MAG: hypothetical protein HQK52_01235 [Oligoflexia bacterium]|nr:hypothetical protein [Oligoflexia bacterium]
MIALWGGGALDADAEVTATAVEEHGGAVGPEKVPAAKSETEKANPDCVECKKNQENNPAKVSEGTTSVTKKNEIVLITEQVVPALNIEELSALVDKIVASKTMSDEDREKLKQLLTQYKKHLKEVEFPKIHAITLGKRELSDEDKNALDKVMMDHLKKFWPDKNFGEFIKMAVNEFDDARIGEQAKELSLYAEYYSKYIEELLQGKGRVPDRRRSGGAAGRGRDSAIKIKLEGFTLTSTDHSPGGISNFINGDINSYEAKRREGAIGSYRGWAENEQAKKERQEAYEEHREYLRAKAEEREELIAGGANFSRPIIRKAKAHHNRYKYYYQTMVRRCYSPVMNQTMCMRAKRDFEKIGKGVHLRKMFNLLELAKKYQDKEKIAKVRQAREEYLSEYKGDDGTTLPIDRYSLFSGDDDVDMAAEFVRGNGDTYEDHFTNDTAGAFDNGSGGGLGMLGGAGSRMPSSGLNASAGAGFNGFTTYPSFGMQGGLQGMGGMGMGMGMQSPPMGGFTMAPGL